jgi:hypothetical protein
MKFLGQHFGIILGICLIVYAASESVEGPSGAGLAGIVGFAVMIASLKYRRFTLPFLNSPVERRRRQRHINPKYDRRMKRY